MNLNFLSPIIKALSGDNPTKRNYALLAVTIIAIVASVYFYISMKNTSTAQAARDMLNPPTNKAEDLQEISKKLTVIAADLQKLRNDVDSKISTDNMILKCGINNQELEKWEISISGKNTLNLKEGDQILLINSYSQHTPSGQFRVKFIRNVVEPNKPEIYINAESAKHFEIDDSERVGVFDLKVQKIR